MLVVAGGHALDHAGTSQSSQAVGDSHRVTMPLVLSARQGRSAMVMLIMGGVWTCEHVKT